LGVFGLFDALISKIKKNIILMYSQAKNTSKKNLYGATRFSSKFDFFTLN
jgi:hypothetical protein